MYGKNLNHKITLRMDDDLYSFVLAGCEVYGLSPSDFVRMCLRMSKSSLDRGLKMLDKTLDEIVSEYRGRIAGQEVRQDGADHKADEHDLV